jgi:hypothetical protein
MGFGWEARRDDPTGRVRCNIMAIAKGYSCASRCFFSEPEIDHFVMAITSAEVIVRHRIEIPQCSNLSAVRCLSKIQNN